MCILLLNTPYLFQYVVPPGPTRFIAPVCNNEGNCLLFRIFFVLTSNVAVDKVSHMNYISVSVVKISLGLS